MSTLKQYCFDTSRATIRKKESYKALQDIVTVMHDYPTHFVIEGHTDSTGSHAIKAI